MNAPNIKYFTSLIIVCDKTDIANFYNRRLCFFNLSNFCKIFRLLKKKKSFTHHEILCYNIHFKRFNEPRFQVNSVNVKN